MIFLNKPTWTPHLLSKVFSQIYSFKFAGNALGGDDDTAELDSSVSTVKRKDKYIGDFTAACKIVLGCEPVAWGELFEENKTTTQKFCEDAL